MRKTYILAALAVFMAVFGIIKSNNFSSSDDTPLLSSNADIHEPNKPIDNAVTPKVNQKPSATIAPASETITEIEDFLESSDVLLTEPEGDLPAEAIPFIAQEAGTEYQTFFDNFSSDESLTEEQIQEFFARMTATIEDSEEAREAIKQAYRKTENDSVVERGILGEMLMQSAAGREILLSEADFILNNGQEQRFADMFETYQNIGGEMNGPVLEQALISAATSTDLRTATSALNYIGNLEQADDFSPVYTNQATRTLEDIAMNNPDDDVRSLAMQKLYRLSNPEKSSEIAEYHLENNPSERAVIETLYSIGSGDVKLSSELTNVLKNALNRPDVTTEEIELAKTILPNSEAI